MVKLVAAFTDLDPTELGLGPAWDSCTLKERTFILEWCKHSSKQAVINAGYSIKNKNCVAVSQCRLLSRKRIQEAILEVTRATMAALGPALVQGLMQLAMGAEDSKTRLQAIGMAMDRFGLPKVTKIESTVEDVTATKEVLEREFRELIQRNPGAAVLFPVELRESVLIDVTPEKPSEAAP